MTNESLEKNNSTHKEEVPSISEAQKVIGDVLDAHLKKLHIEEERHSNPLHRNEGSRHANIIHSDITKTQKALDEIHDLQACSRIKDDCLSDGAREVINQLLDKSIKEIGLELKKTYYPKDEDNMGDREIDDVTDRRFSYPEKIKSMKRSIHFMREYQQHELNYPPQQDI